MEENEMVRKMIVDKARENLYRFFSLALSNPRGPRWNGLLDPDFQKGVLLSGELIGAALENGRKNRATENGRSASSSLEAAVRYLSGGGMDRCEAYDRLFGFVPQGDCLPYETEYNALTFPVSRSQSLADVAGFYRAFGLESSPDEPERPDHLSLEFEFMARLIEKEWYAREKKGADSGEKAQICVDAQRRFFQEHLLWWVPGFSILFGQKAMRVTREPLFYRGGALFFYNVAQSISLFISDEAGHFQVPPPKESALPRDSKGVEENQCSMCNGTE